MKTMINRVSFLSLLSVVLTLDFDNATKFPINYCAKFTVDNCYTSQVTNIFKDVSRPVKLCKKTSAGCVINEGVMKPNDAYGFISTDLNCMSVPFTNPVTAPNITKISTTAVAAGSLASIKTACGAKSGKISIKYTTNSTIEYVNPGDAKYTLRTDLGAVQEIKLVVTDGPTLDKGETARIYFAADYAGDYYSITEEESYVLDIATLYKPIVSLAVGKRFIAQPYIEAVASSVYSYVCNTTPCTLLPPGLYTTEITLITNLRFIAFRRMCDTLN